MRNVVNLQTGQITLDAPYTAEEQAARDAAAVVYNSVEAVRERLTAQVIALMIEKQDGGITFNGIPVSTDNNANGDLTGAKLAPKASRKIVTRKGGGAKVVMTSAQLDALFDAVEQYRQDVMDRAYDLLTAIEAEQAVDVDTGWPSNIITG